MRPRPAPPTQIDLFFPVRFPSAPTTRFCSFYFFTGKIFGFFFFPTSQTAGNYSQSYPRRHVLLSKYFSEIKNSLLLHDQYSGPPRIVFRTSHTSKNKPVYPDFPTARLRVVRKQCRVKSIILLIFFFFLRFSLQRRNCQFR